MAKKFYCNGITGVTAIYNPAVPAALTNPMANLGAVYFHSSLDYMGIALDLTIDVTHPQRNRGSNSPHYNYPEPIGYMNTAGTITHNLGYMPHGLVFIGNDMMPACTQIQFVGSSFRTAAVELDFNTVKIFETAYVYRDNLPQLIQRYRIVLFTPKLGEEGNKAVFIKDDQFIANKGKLNSDRNYLRRSLASPMLWFSRGQTADTANGGYKIVTANGSVITRTPYNGNFAGIPGLGVEV